MVRFQLQLHLWPQAFHPHWLPEAAVTDYRRLGGLNNRNLFSHTSGGQNSKINFTGSIKYTGVGKSRFTAVHVAIMQINNTIINK